MAGDPKRVLGPYEIQTLLAHSGDTLRFSARDTRDDQLVMLQLLAPAAARDSGSVDQFLQDAAQTAALAHDHILPVLDYGQIDGVAYAAQPIPSGGALREHLAEFADERDAANMVDTVAAALEYVHAQGSVNGNLKPENIYLDDAGAPLLANLSFGALRGQGSVYNSPEQAQSGTVDARTDVYALGVLLYELLAGAPPPVGKPADLRAVRPDATAAVGQIVRTATAVYPDQRFSSVAAMRQALHEVIPPPTEAEAPTPARRPQSPSMTNQRVWLFYMIGALVVLVLATLAYVLLFAEPPGETVPLPETETLMETAVPTPTPASTPPPSPTTAAATLTAIADTDIRSGPGDTYPLVGTLRGGQAAPIVGVSPDRTWWVISLPSAPDDQGWIPSGAGEAANVSGVPYVQAPPPPAEPTP